MSQTTQSVAGLPALGLVLILLAGPTSVADAPRDGAERASRPEPAQSAEEPRVMPAGVRAHNVVMHLHGHSNHNATVPKGQVASMQWHAAQAALHGDETVLWWSDHLGMFDQAQAFMLTFRAGQDIQILNNLDVIGIRPRGTSTTEITRLGARHDGGTPTASLLPNGLVVGLTGEAGEEWRTFSYEVQSGAPDALIHGQKFARPISSGAIFDLALDCDSPGPDAACEFEVRLAWHYDDRPLQHTLHYRIDSEVDGRVATVTAPGEMLIRLPRRRDGLYRLDLLADAGPLVNGDDNTINRVRLGLRARRGATGAMTFSGFRLTSSRPAKHQQLASVQEFARRYGEAYDQTHHVGLEYGDRDWHVNAFFPEPLGPENEALLEVEIGYSVPRWIRAVRELGGVVSLNHPFLKRDTLCRPGAPDRACILAAAQKLLDSQASEADLLEVGYLDRGMDVSGHLELWDQLTASGLFLYGTGVTDSHGGEWQAQINPMTTWILAPSSSAPDLLEAVRAGRMYFGNPLEWSGDFGFRVGRALMGDRLPSPGGSQLLTFELDPWPEDYRVFLVQGLIQPDRSVEYLHRRTRLKRGVTRRIDTSRPSFVRLEAWQVAGERQLVPIAFTNPVVLHP